MKRLAVFAFLALAGCSWASFTTKAWPLRDKTGDEFLSALDSGVLSLPDGVSVLYDQPGGIATLSVSGEEKTVDAALHEIGAWDRTPQLFLIDVTIPLRQGTRFPERPILRTTTGRPASIALRDPAGNITWEFRVSASLTGKGAVATRASVGLGGSYARLVVPFLLGAEEEVSVDKEPDGDLELTATDSTTKVTRKARLSPDLRFFAGLRFTIKTTAVNGPA